MKDLLESDLELVHRSAFVFLPLPFDPSVAEEIEDAAANELVIRNGGGHFVRTISLRSLVDGFGASCPKAYDGLRRSCLKRISGDPAPAETVASERLKEILFSVMPHFVRRGKRLDRRRLTEEDVLDLIEERAGLPGKSAMAAAGARDPDSIRRILAELEVSRPAAEPLPEGRMPARTLADWLARAQEDRILEEERQRLTGLLSAKEGLHATATRRLAILRCVAEKGTLEIDGFGFLRTGPGDDYLIYKRTGEYALKDYYGRPYLFPDCRVAVSTAASLRPFVVETYKHPFLEAHDSGQEICLKRFTPARRFSGASAVVEALREGISALLHGYSSRRRNGYHSLEGLRRSVRSPGPYDIGLPEPPDEMHRRNRHILDVDFDDYRIPADHPGIASGQVEITNDVVP
jgi:hypothetical protein